MLERVVNTPCAQAAIDDDPEIQQTLDELRREGLTDNEPPERGSARKRYADMAFEWYVNSLLSNPKTHMVNAVSNMVPLTSRIGETAMSALSAKVFRTAGEKATFQELLAEVHGVHEGFVAAFKFLKARIGSVSGRNDELLTQQQLPEALAARSKLEYDRRNFSGANTNWESDIVKRGFDWVGAAVNKPGQALSTGDTFFKVINYHAEISKQAMRQAMADETLSAVERTQLFHRLKAQARTDQSSDLVAKGLADSEFRTYTNRPEGKLNRLMAEKGHDSWLRWIVPFRRTMVNILNYSAEMTPGVNYLTSSKTRQAIHAGGAARDDALGRMSFGTMTLGSIYYLLGDRLDGEAPMHPQARDLWAKDGHKADSIRIGDSHIPLDMFGPMAPMLKAMARYQTFASGIDVEADDTPYEKVETAAAELLFAMSDVAFSEHWVENITDLVTAIESSRREEDPRALTIYASRLASGFNPNVVKQLITKNIDPGVKDITDPFVAFIAKVPLWSKSVPNKIDLWGDEMTYDHFLDPSIASKVTGQDPVSVEMRRIQMELPDVRRTQAGVKMTPLEFQKFMIYSGKGSFGMPPLRDEITRRIRSPLYGKFVTDEGRAEYLRDAILTYREAARAAIMQDPDFSFGQRVQAEQQAKQQKLRTR